LCREIGLLWKTTTTVPKRCPLLLNPRQTKELRKGIKLLEKTLLPQKFGE